MEYTQLVATSAAFLGDKARSPAAISLSPLELAESSKSTYVVAMSSPPSSVEENSCSEQLSEVDEPAQLFLLALDLVRVFLDSEGMDFAIDKRVFSSVSVILMVVRVLRDMETAEIVSDEIRDRIGLHL